jgi:hypothetical protein
MLHKVATLWRRTSKNDKQYFTGVLHDITGDIQVVGFYNNKQNDKQPDIQLFRDDGRDDNRNKSQQGDTREQDWGGFNGSAPDADADVSEPRDDKIEYPQEDINPEDIPF